MLTFAAGSGDMHGAGKRLVNQAKSSGLFTKTLLITEEDLLNLNEDGLKLKLFADIYPRGFGLFSWKSYILNLAMQGEFGEFDGVFYADAGCELLWNKKSLENFVNLMEKTKVAGILAFSTLSPEYQYTKKEVLGMLRNSADIYSPQIEATVIFANPNDHKAGDLIGSWWSLSSQDGFRYLVDPDPALELDGFIDHRHDQSILSILLKNNGIASLPESTPRYTKKNIALLHYIVFTPWPIWAIRNRTSSTRLRSWQTVTFLSILLNPLHQNRLFVFKVYKYIVHFKFAIIYRLKRIFPRSN